MWFICTSGSMWYTSWPESFCYLARGLDGEGEGVVINESILLISICFQAGPLGERGLATSQVTMAMSDLCEMIWEARSSEKLN